MLSILEREIQVKIGEKGQKCVCLYKKVDTYYRYCQIGVKAGDQRK